MRDVSPTDQRLLEVAIDHFGRLGREGASTRAIAKDADTLMSSITYHFKGKDGLYLACAEHIALSEDGIAGMGKATLKSPEEPDKAVRGDAARAGDQKLLDGVVDRSHKAQAPEPLQPKHKFATPQEAVDHFRLARDANIDYIEKTQDDLRAHSAPGPAGPMDGYRWFLLMSAHTERHTKQIKEVKADANYPK